jgi:hypothetical protein
LFINDIGSWEWRPQAAYPNVPNIYFAGDFCQTDVDMATMEAAVQSGILAARAIQADDAARNNTTRGAPIAMAGHRLYSTTTFRAAKLALLPYAYLAVAWAAYEQDKRAVQENPAARADGQYRLSEYALLLPLQFSLDWLKSAYWLARCLTSDDASVGVRSTITHDAVGSGDAPTAAATKTTVDDDDTVIGLAEATLGVVGDLFDNLANSLPKRGETASGAVTTFLSGLARLAGDVTMKAADAFAANQAGASGATPPAGFRRRARIKP